MSAIKRLIRWCVAAAASEDGGAYPTQQVSYLGKASRAAVAFPYGFHANVPVGTIGLLLQPHAKGENHVVQWTSGRKRPKACPQGELIYYNPETLAEVRLLQDGSIVLTTGAGGTKGYSTNTGTVVMTNTGTFTIISENAVAISAAAGSAAINLVGNVTVTGTLAVNGASAALPAVVTAAGQDIGNVHTHGGVTTGGGTSGAPNS